MNIVSRLNSRKGQGATEYLLIAAVVVAAVIVLFSQTEIQDILTGLVSKIQGQVDTVS